eukprot:GHVQ01004785.1.p1 GENE.GHVQ01004785.1~~GHVQ01004785.1.p1  ORF type:complete len:168 (+),score=29.56 GHVQ01004785.1:152-655(+)
MAATAGDAPKKIKLISCEGDEVLVEPEVALMSSFVRTMLEDSSDAVPLPQVRTAVLEKIIDYCRYHHQNPHETVEIAKPLKSSNIADAVCAWDAKFVDVDQAMLNEIIVAANFMDIKPLLDLTCAKVASKLKGKSPEEIRKEFNIVNDFTPEEEAQVREENKWCEEM